MMAAASQFGGLASQAPSILACIARSIITLIKVAVSSLATLVLVEAFAKLLMIFTAVSLFFAMASAF
jgi:hypothetical protein